MHKEKFSAGFGWLNKHARPLLYLVFSWLKEKQVLSENDEELYEYLVSIDQSKSWSAPGPSVGPPGRALALQEKH